MFLVPCLSCFPANVLFFCFAKILHRDHRRLFPPQLCSLLLYPTTISATICITTMFSSSVSSDLRANSPFPSFHPHNTAISILFYTFTLYSAQIEFNCKYTRASDLSNTIYLMCSINLAYRWQHDIQLFKTLICVLGIS